MYKGVVSIYMCYSEGDGINTPLSRLSYLGNVHGSSVVHLYPDFVRYQVPHVLDAHVNDI